MKITEPIRDRNQVRQLADYYLNRGEIRNHVLIVLSLCTALRISDILRLTWDDVYDFKRQRVRKSINISEQKTRKPKIIEINSKAVAALNRYISEASPSVFLIKNRQTGKAISRVQAHRIIRTAGEAIDIEQNVSCHSLRKTFGYQSWKCGISIEVLMEIYNHSSPAVTRRYLGITQDYMNEAYRGFDY